MASVFQSLALFAIAMAACSSGLASAASTGAMGPAVGPPSGEVDRIIMGPSVPWAKASPPSKLAAVKTPLTSQEQAEDKAIDSAMSRGAASGKDKVQIQLGSFADAVKSQLSQTSGKSLLQTLSTVTRRVRRFSMTDAELKTTGNLEHGEMGIWNLNVGNADSALIHLDGVNVVIDVGRSNVYSLLQKLGVNRIDLLILSHAHADHIRGVKKLLHKIFAKTIVFGTTTSSRKKYYTEIDAYASSDTERIWLDKDQYRSIKIGDLEGYVLSSPLDPSSTPENDLSVYTQFNYGGNAFVFTGDAENDLQKQWMAFFEAQSWTRLPHTMYYKVSHHGAKNGVESAFWPSGTKCGVAVFSTSGTSTKPKTYGHPTKEAVAHFKSVCLNSYFTSSGHVLHLAKADGDGEVMYDISLEDLPHDDDVTGGGLIDISDTED